MCRLPNFIVTLWLSIHNGKYRQLDDLDIQGEVLWLCKDQQHNERVKFHYKLTNEAFIFRQLKKAGEGA